MHGGWSEWAYGDACSKQCGQGVATRTRTCDSPRPSWEGRACAGDASGKVKCIVRPCCELIFTMARMLNPVTRAYAGPFRGRIRGRKEKRPLIGVARGRSKIVMLNGLCEMRMRMGNVNGIQCCRIPIYGTNQMRMAFSFAFGGGFGSHPDWPHSHLGKLGPNRPCPLNGLR